MEGKRVDKVSWDAVRRAPRCQARLPPVCSTVSPEAWQASPIGGIRRPSCRVVKCCLICRNARVVADFYSILLTRTIMPGDAAMRSGRPDILDGARPADGMVSFRGAVNAKGRK